MAGALAYRPDGSGAALMFQIKEGSYNTGSLIGFLEDLHEHVGAAQVTLIWDDLPSHRSKAMQTWIASRDIAHRRAARPPFRSGSEPFGKQTKLALGYVTCGDRQIGSEPHQALTNRLDAPLQDLAPSSGDGRHA